MGEHPISYMSWQGFRGYTAAIHPYVYPLIYNQSREIDFTFLVQVALFLYPTKVFWAFLSHTAIYNTWQQICH